MDFKDAIGAAFGGVPGVDTILGAAGSVYSARQQEENQRRSIKAQERFAQNKYQWQMADMEKAGLNPILAAGQAPSGSSGAGASGAPTVHKSEVTARHLMREQQKLQEEKQLTEQKLRKKMEADYILAYEQSNLVNHQANSARYQEQMDKLDLALKTILTDYYIEYPLMYLLKDQGSDIGSMFNSGKAILQELLKKKTGK